MKKMADSTWMNTYDAVFFVSIATLICGILTALIRLCIKLKCEQVSLCFGLIKVDRRVDLEVQEEIRALEINNGEVSDDIQTPKADSLPQKRDNLSLEPPMKTPHRKRVRPGRSLSLPSLKEESPAPPESRELHLESGPS